MRTFELNAIVHGDGNEYDWIAARFCVTHNMLSDNDALDTIRRAVANWGKTEGGRNAAREIWYDFNWGDLSQYLELIPFGEGLTVERIPQVDTLIVNHDEVLIAPTD